MPNYYLKGSGYSMAYRRRHESRLRVLEGLRRDFATDCSAPKMLHALAYYHEQHMLASSSSTPPYTPYDVLTTSNATFYPIYNTSKGENSFIISTCGEGGYSLEPTTSAGVGGGGSAGYIRLIIRPSFTYNNTTYTLQSVGYSVTTKTEYGVTRHVNKTTVYYNNGFNIILNPEYGGGPDPNNNRNGGLGGIPTWTPSNINIPISTYLYTGPIVVDGMRGFNAQSGSIVIGPELYNGYTCQGAGTNEIGFQYPHNFENQLVDWIGTYKIATNVANPNSTLQIKQFGMQLTGSSYNVSSLGGSSNPSSLYANLASGYGAGAGGLLNTGPTGTNTIIYGKTGFVQVRANNYISS